MYKLNIEIKEEGKKKVAANFLDKNNNFFFLLYYFFFLKIIIVNFFFLHIFSSIIKSILKTNIQNLLWRLLRESVTIFFKHTASSSFFIHFFFLFTIITNSLSLITILLLYSFYFVIRYKILLVWINATAASFCCDNPHKRIKLQWLASQIN